MLQAGLDRTGLTLMPVNGRILLANLLRSSRSTFSWRSFPSFFAFKAGMWDTQISALLSSPTVSGRFVKHWRHIGQPTALSELAAGVEHLALDAVAQEKCYEALRTRSEK
jgi:hypothetical protein